MVNINSKRKASVIFLVIAVFCFAASPVAFKNALELLAVGGASAFVSIYLLLMDIAQSAAKSTKTKK